MTITIANNLFSDAELEEINKVIDDALLANEEWQVSPDEQLGRLKVFLILPENIKNRLVEYSSNLLGFEAMMAHCIYVEYNSKYGQPNLPPHFDADTNNLVIDYQLTANTSWDLGVDLKSYPLENNSALIFNANEYVHWRPHKIFKDQEYVKMIFIRFFDPKNIPDYSHLRLSQDHEAFKNHREFRDSLGHQA